MNRRIFALLERVRHPSPRMRRFTTALIGLAAAGYLFTTATLQHRDFFPTIHDEFQFSLQARMLAQGKLWMPPHPLADFFDTFYVLTRPVYAAQSFPGSALLFVPGVWLNWPGWVIPLLLSGAVVGLIYRIIAELVDGAAGILAAALLVSLPIFRMLSIMPMAQIPVLLLGLLSLWAWLHWRREHRLGWAAAIGFFAGWAAITRPVDAICFAGPVGIAILFDCGRRSWPLLLRDAMTIAAGATPFLILQLTFNYGVTGSVFKTPFSLYNDRDQPRLGFGFERVDTNVHPATIIIQKRIAYETWMLDQIRHHTWHNLPADLITRRLPMMVRLASPSRWLLLLIPVGLLALNDRRRWVLWASLPLFFTLYAFYPLFLSHYTLMAAPGMILSMVLGANVIANAWPRHRAMMASLLTLIILAAAISSLAELNPEARDQYFQTPTLRFIQEVFPAQIKPPAVVLFRFDPATSNPQEEPVYNVDAAWPDDAPIIRAHDLGPERNIEIFRYYAEHQPRRMFYLFDRGLYDRGLAPLKRLGTAAELVQEMNN